MPYEAVLAIMVLSIVGVGFYSLVEPIAEELDLIAYERTVRARVAQAARNQAARDRADASDHVPVLRDRLARARARLEVDTVVVPFRQPRIQDETEMAA